LRQKPPDKAASMRLRLAAVDYLAAVKSTHKYSELEKGTGLKPSVLNRYVKARVLPSEKRAKELVQILSKSFGLTSLILEHVTVDGYGMVDDTNLISSPRILRLAAVEAAMLFSDSKVDKVVTMASDGIPYASFLADLLGSKLVVAKKEREKGVKKFHSSEVLIGDSGVSITAYAPAHILRKGDRCLIVDDLVRSGETQEALTQLVRSAGCEVVGYCFLVAVTNRWRERIEPNKVVQVFATVGVD